MIYFAGLLSAAATGKAQYAGTYCLAYLENLFSLSNSKSFGRNISPFAQ
jgi:hypothetical protein